MKHYAPNICLPLKMAKFEKGNNSRSNFKVQIFLFFHYSFNGIISRIPETHMQKFQLVPEV